MNNQTREKVGGGQYVKNALNCNRKCTGGCWWMEPKERGWRSISRRMMQSEHSPCLGPTRWLIHLAAIKQPIYLMWKVALFDNSEKGKKEKARRETCKKACASAAGVSQKTSLILISEQWKKKKIAHPRLFFFPFFSPQHKAMHCGNVNVALYTAKLFSGSKVHGRTKGRRIKEVRAQESVFPGR